MDTDNFVPTHTQRRDRVWTCFTETGTKLLPLLDQFPVGCLVHNRDLTCAHLNPAAEKIFHYTAADLTGKDPADWIVPVGARSSFQERLQTVLENSQPFTFESENVTKSGQAIFCEWQSAPLRDDEGQVVGLLSVVKDITGLKARESKIAAQAERLAALRTIDLAIAERQELTGLLNIVLRQALSLLKMDAAIILVLDRQSELLTYATGIGLRTSALRYTKLRLGEGYAGRAALQKKMIIIPDLDHRQTDFLRSPMFRIEAFKSYACAPLIFKGEVIGALEGFFRNRFTPDADWSEFFEALGGQAAIAIESVNLFHSLQRSNQELTQSYDHTLEGWSRALDLRDRDTEGHTRRVTAMTERLAAAMNIAEQERVHIRRGAILHDIGKIGIPDRILLKEGPLDEEEWDIVRRHPLMAHEILSPIRYLHPALDIPYCHHERWDGSGYPRGLQGERIPLPARIFAVVDVFDALTSDRPYRPAWSTARALDYVRAGSGSHFDPEVVNVFLEIFNQTG